MPGSTILSPMLAAGAILLSVALLIMGNGLQVMLLPIRGGLEGFSALEVGLLGSGYFLGFVVGCVLTPRLIMRAGHIRTFAALVSIASAAAFLGFFFAYHMWQVWKDEDGTAARPMFFFSIVYLFLIFMAMLVDRLMFLPMFKF